MMAKYLLIYRSPKEQHKHEVSPDQMQKIMESWNTWIGKGMEAGWMVSPGDALKIEAKL